MVATAKLRGAEARLKNSRPLMEMVEEMSAKFEDAPASKKTTFIPISTDRGLCGGVNVNLAKKVANEMIPAETAAGAEVSIACVGDKGRSQFNRLCKESVKKSVTGVFAQVVPNFAQASVIAEQALAEEADKYSIVY